ncbi:hypothetical protein AB0M54_02405 [Actinoplanes sp. NPDC051470]|uniref:hypothetical protein n=1 Tax=unclassified Actinoplanes TaxID=2626549 RepID=UPI00342DF610
MTVESSVRPVAVRALTWLLAATAAATVVVELLNFWYAPEPGLGLWVRTGWALLRTLGWLILIAQVRRGRAGARPFGLILAVTTIFAVGRLVVPQTGAPVFAGVVGFGVLVVLCVSVVALLYRHPAVGEHLVRHPRKVTFGRDGLTWDEGAPRREVSGWLMTARVSAFTYSPLMLVPCLISVGELGDKPEYLLAVIFWFVAGFGVSYVVLLTTFFLLRGKRFARVVLAWAGAAVLLIDLPLCYLLLGLDGLVRDGAPLVVAVALSSYALIRTRNDRP